jgi:hypothetical protein
LNGLGQRNGWRQVKQKMRVVRHAIDSYWSDFLVAADASQIRPEFRLGIFGYGGLTIFCTEHEMEMIFNERVRHELCKPFQGFDSILLHFPPLMRVGSIISFPPLTRVGSIISPCRLLSRGSALDMAKSATSASKRAGCVADGRECCEIERSSRKLFNVLIRSFFPAESTLEFDITY